MADTAMPDGGARAAAPPRLLILWSMPRSRSTAFFRMMAERGDMAVVHEPFSYLAEFGSTEIDGRKVSTQRELVSALREKSAREPVFVKDTTDERYADVLTDDEFLATDATHTFLVRHPRETIASYHRVNPRVACHQIGAEHLYELHAAVTAAAGQPVVVDAADLVDEPAGVLRRYCESVGIPFLPSALTWSAGERAEWRPSAAWHRDVSRTTGFVSTPDAARPPLDVDTDPVLRGYLAHHLPYYEKVRASRIRP